MSRNWTSMRALAVAGVTIGTINGAAHGTTLYWDGDGTGAVGNPPTSGAGGAGTWDGAASNWWTGTAYQSWATAGGQDIADFRGTAATVSISGTVSANNVNFNTTGYTIGGTGTLNLTGAHQITVNVTTATISSVISGSSGLRKSGGGTTLQLAGTANTYSGGTVVDNNSGILSIVGDGSLGDAGGGLTMGSSTTFTRTNAGGDVMLNSGRTITLNGVVSFRPASNLSTTQSITLAGQVTGASGSLATSANFGGVLILSNANNNYGGMTTVGRSSFIRIAGGDNRLPVGTLLTIEGQSTAGFTNGCVFDLNGLNQTVGGLTGGAGSVVTGKMTNTLANSTSTITVTNTINATANPGGDANFSGIIQDTGTGKVALVKSVGGTQTLSAANTYTGSTTITGGTLALASTGSIANTPTININGGTFNTSAKTGFLTGSGQTLKGQGTFAVAGTGTTTVGGVLSIGQAHSSVSSVASTLAVTGGNLALSDNNEFDLLTGGGSADKLTVGGDLSYGGTLVVANPTGISFAAGQSWDLFDATTFSGALLNTFNVAGGGGSLPVLPPTLAWNFVPATGVLSVVTVPEPASFVVLGLVAVGVLARRRRPA